jgi:hypothetical protein
MIVKETKCVLTPMAYTCNHDYLGGCDLEDFGLRPVQPRNLLEPISKKIRPKWTDSVAQAVQGLLVSLLYKCEVQSSNPSPPIKKAKTKC